MIRAFLILIGCALAGDGLRIVLHLPIPGPVLGMLVLTAALALRGEPAGASGIPSPLDRVADALLANMGLLFVPAGVGIIAEAGVLRGEWVAVAVAVVGSTIIGLAVTGLVMHALVRPAATGPMPAVAPKGARS